MSNQAQRVVTTLLTHLRSNDQLGLLPDVVEMLKNSSEYKNSQNRVVVTSATKLDASELKQLKAYLVKSIGGQYELIEAQDPSLLAGFTLQVNDTFIDASVLGKINSVSNKLTAKD